MPVIKCSECGFRIVHSGNIFNCPNCGYPVRAASDPFVRGDDASTPADATEAMLPAVVVPSSRWRQDSFFAPHDANPGIPPNPFDSFVDSDAFEEEVHPGESDGGTSIPIWKPNNQFLSFLQVQRAPDVEGIVIQIQAQEEPPQPGIVGAMGGLFLEVIWAIPNVPTQPDRDKVRVTTLRVRTAASTQRDIRMEGHLRGVNVTLGDAVSLWGFKRKGLLVFIRGYNHTSQGPIMTTTTDSTGRGLLLFLLIIAMLILIFYLGGPSLGLPPTILHLLPKISLPSLPHWKL